MLTRIVTSPIWETLPGNWIHFNIISKLGDTDVSLHGSCWYCPKIFLLFQIIVDPLSSTLSIGLVTCLVYYIVCVGIGCEYRVYIGGVMVDSLWLGSARAHFGSPLGSHTFLHMWHSKSCYNTIYTSLSMKFLTLSSQCLSSLFSVQRGIMLLREEKLIASASFGQFFISFQQSFRRCVICMLRCGTNSTWRVEA